MILHILGVIFAFNILIFAHELGHFLTARLMGLPVEEFAIGFGRKIFSFKVHETTYSLRLIPLGGFNRIPHLDTDKLGSDTDLLGYLKRAIVLAAGSLFNFVSAFVVLFLAVCLIGLPGSSTEIARVDDASIAANALQTGDRIVQVDDEKLFKGEQVPIYLYGYMKANDSLSLTVERDGKLLPLTLTKYPGEPLGITFATDYYTLSVNHAADVAAEAFIYIGGQIVDETAKLFKNPSQDMVKAMSGPVGISAVMYEAQEAMGMFGLAFIFAFVSINVGIVNLLPIPIFDGGHILLQGIQFITRNAIGERMLRLCNYAGLAIIVVLFSLGLYGDAARIFLQ